MGLNNIATSTGAGRPFQGPIMPSHPPRLGELTLKAVNANPLVRSEATPDSFLFRKDSAGMGVPRDELGKLEKFSQHANEKGTARTAIYFEASSVPAGAKGQSASASMLSMHRGSPPPSASSFSPSSGQSSRGTSSSTSGSTSSAHASSSSSSSSGHH
jgi:hypothetical protein